MNALRSASRIIRRQSIWSMAWWLAVGGYGNAFGVPTVGGEVQFDASYNGNCLVNAFAAGLAKHDGHIPV